MVAAGLDFGSEVAEPIVENGVLKIAPFDFPNLLGYVNKNHSNEFDIFRLKALGVERIKELMAKKKSDAAKKYYANCLALIEGAKIGIYVERMGARVPTRPFGNLDFIQDEICGPSFRNHFGKNARIKLLFLRGLDGSDDFIGGVEAFVVDKFHPPAKRLDASLEARNKEPREVRISRWCQSAFYF